MLPFGDTGFFLCVNFADAARRWEDEGRRGAVVLWFTTVLGLEGPMSPRARSCAVARNSCHLTLLILLNLFKNLLQRGVVYTRFSCRHLATQGASAWRRSVSPQK